MFGGPEQLVGRVIGGYQLERMLGTGAMGAVFQGRSAANPQMIVAIKLLIIPWNATAEDREHYQARFRREAQTLMTSATGTYFFIDAPITTPASERFIHL